MLFLVLFILLYHLITCHIPVETSNKYSEYGLGTMPKLYGCISERLKLHQQWEGPWHRCKHLHVAASLADTSRRTDDLKIL